MKHELAISGMHCNSCKVLITDLLEDLGAKGITVAIDEKKQVGKVHFEGDRQSAKKAIEKEGYKVL